MKRKLVRQGAATLMVSIPSKWAKENKLGKGSEIDIEQSGSDLILSAAGSEGKSETEISIAGLPESSIRSIIANTYRRGFDRIKVSFETEKQFDAVKRFVKASLIGFDVIKKEKDYCIIENITEPSIEQFDTIIKKIFYSIAELFEITEKRFDNPKETYDYADIEERILSYDNFCKRVVSKRKLYSQNSEFFWTFLTFVTYGQRELYFLNNLLEEKAKVSKKTKELLQESKQLFELLMKAYLEKDIKLLGKIHDKEKEISKTRHELLQSSKGTENAVIYHIMILVREFHHSANSLAGLII
jgi:phosphate uptake regulator